MPRRIPTYYVYDDECSIKEEYSNPKILYKELMHWLKSNGKDEEVVVVCGVVIMIIYLYQEILLIWETKDPKMEMEYAKVIIIIIVINSIIILVIIRSCNIIFLLLLVLIHHVFPSYVYVYHVMSIYLKIIVIM